MLWPGRKLKARSILPLDSTQLTINVDHDPDFVDFATMFARADSCFDALRRSVFRSIELNGAASQDAKGATAAAAITSAWERREVNGMV
jgi:hypothetical protein